MNLKITGKTALVLGGSQGLGKAIAEQLAAEGARVVIVGRDAAKLDVVARNIGNDCLFLKSDLTQGSAAKSIFGKVTTMVGPPEILINNCGGPSPSLASEVSIQDIEKQIQPMLLSIIELSQLVLTSMKQNNWGRVVTIASSGAIAPIPNLAVSNTLRAGLVAWNKTAAAEMAAFGITMNVVAPGRIDTERVRSLDANKAASLDQSVEKAKASSLKNIPAGRYGTAEEFAAAATFLASEPASYITGVTLRIDGGLVKST